MLPSTLRKEMLAKARSHQPAFFAAHKPEIGPDGVQCMTGRQPWGKRDSTINPVIAGFCIERSDKKGRLTSDPRLEPSVSSKTPDKNLRVA